MSNGQKDYLEDKIKDIDIEIHYHKTIIDDIKERLWKIEQQLFGGKDISYSMVWIMIMTGISLAGIIAMLILFLSGVSGGNR